MSAVPPAPSRWELAAETIAVKVRWFGLLVGCVVVHVTPHDPARLALLDAILSLGALFTLLDTYYSVRGTVFLGRYPLFVSLMESLFIGLLCYHDAGLDSPFRYYYFLSVLCCAVRHPSPVTYLTCALHCVSLVTLALALPDPRRHAFPLALTVVMLGWVTWASASLALLLKRVGEHLARLNDALRTHQVELEQRIADRTRELQESQAHVLHQEKMAAFGLLAAGIAHEVGNPLTSISSIVQMLQMRGQDDYTGTKLGLVSGQLKRIQGTLRELIEFSRPASSERVRVSLADILDEALNIAKYYKRTPGRIASPAVPPDLPPLHGVRDQLVQVFLNLILNAIDATDRGGRIELTVGRDGGWVRVAVADTGTGIPADQAGRLFRPYFTTKRHGTGLGLFVTRRLVRDHGGDVGFDSAPGEGTTFTVRLPLYREAA
ncbi:MAG: sensor histidine kinase [Gemmataceae bacterium]